MKNKSTMMYRKDVQGRCRYNRFVDCDRKADCTTCGWNPDCHTCRVMALRLMAQVGLLVRR